MSISAAMSNAVQGLRAAGYGADVISSNVANALTPGYSRRVLELTTNAVGGVSVVGVSRAVDASLASDRRLADAENSGAEQTVNFFAKLESLLGKPGDPGSLSSRYAEFESALITAASRPDAPDRLAAAVDGANHLINGLREASDGVQAIRLKADSTIATKVRELNDSLQHIQKLNAQIASARGQGVETASLLDQRQVTVDQISKIVPVREMQREQGRIALYSLEGVALIDGKVSSIDFTKSNTVTPFMSIGAGTLSGLTVNNEPVRINSNNGALRGGSLSAQFAIRDEHSVSAQSEIDALSRDLVERFQSPSVDNTLALADAGLFTDDGQAFQPQNELGLAQRLKLNAAVDPEQGGFHWRLRDGIKAGAEGPVGDSTLLRGLSDALSIQHSPASGSFSGHPRSATNLVSVLTSNVGSDLTLAERNLSYSSVRLTELSQRQLNEGVDTDIELQRLLQVEQTYAANARLIETVDEMMQILTRL